MTGERYNGRHSRGRLKAELVEIYTDVDGISTADPNLLKKPGNSAALYTEVCQLAYEGAR